MIKIAPSILSADFSNLARDIKIIEKAGADMVHIDVMDGHFVPNITIGPLVVKSLRKVTSLTFDVHLMIENPENYIKDFVDAGSDIITVHAEASKHLHRLIQLIKSYDVKAGIALNPATPLCAIEHFIDDADEILIMTVNPGFGGQKFIENMYEKITTLRNILNNKGKNTPIEVDGGVSLNNIEKLYKCGARIMVAGSAIFNSGDIEKTIGMMRNISGE